MSNSELYMQRALMLARIAEQKGEIPVGAVIVYQDEIIAEAHNSPISLHDCSAHAEILALRQAGKILGNYRLPDTEMYVTLEPCVMCAGALVHARIKKLVFASTDPRKGAAGSVFNLVNNTLFNHQICVQSGLLKNEARELLQTFFKKRRQAKNVQTVI